MEAIAKSTTSLRSEKPESQDSFLETLDDWFRSCTCHGIPNIYKNGVFLKIIWTLSFIISMGYCAFLVYNSITKYLVFEVVTQITSQFDNPSTFPAVTICNLNPFATNESLAYVQYSMTSQGINGVNSPLLKMLVDYPPSQISSNILFLRHFITHNAMLLNDTVKKSFGYTDSLIIACMFGTIPCDPSDFIWYYDVNYGNCLQYNSGYNSTGAKISYKKTLQTGKLFGLTLLAFVGIPNHPNTLSLDTGAHVFIHNQSDSPSIAEGLDVATGKQANIAIYRTFSRQLPMPYNDCYDDLTSPDAFDSYIYRKTLELGYRYSQKSCVTIATEYYFSKTCNCTDATYSRLLGVPACTTFNDLRCQYRIGSLILNSKSITDSFLEQCPLECSRQTMNFITSNSEFPSDSYAAELLADASIVARMNAIGYDATLENLKRCIVYISVYYDLTEYTMISETPATIFNDLMCAIGGSLGLCLGMSFLTFMEFFEVIFHLIQNKCCCRLDKRKTNKVKNTEENNENEHASKS